MTEDYCKLASGIILSTIWREDDHTRILWITLLAVKGRDHCVRASVPGLAAVANIPIEAVRIGLQKLMSPDPESRTKEFEGRRIAEVDGGWVILNGEKYRNYMTKQERNEYQAKLMASRRATKKLADVSKRCSKLAELGQAEAEAEAEANTKPPIVPQGGIGVEIPESLRTPEFLEAWKNWLEYRKTTRKPVSVLAAEKQLKKCLEWGIPKAIEGIEFSIASDYQGLYLPKASSRPVPPTTKDQMLIDAIG